MSDIDALIADMRAGMEGVTPGEWEYVPAWCEVDPARVESEDYQIASFTTLPDRDAAHANAKRLVRCSPGNIARLLDEIEALRERLRRAEQLMDENWKALPREFASVKDMMTGIEAIRTQLATTTRYDARIAELEAERDLARKMLSEIVKREAKKAAHSRAWVEQTEAQNNRLRAALQPFKALADEIEHCAAQYPEGAPERDPDCWMKSCTWPDLVRAREALKETK